jgi:hypothetical protein
MLLTGEFYGLARLRWQVNCTDRPGRDPRNFPELVRKACRGIFWSNQSLVWRKHLHLSLHLCTMSESLTYQYASPSIIQHHDNQSDLFLAKYSEIEKTDQPCFFWGRMNDPHTLARCLVTLSNVVKSSFSLSPADLAKLKDPIVTAGNERVRFEGFSFCAGVYARVDVLPGGYDGEFPGQGTTNVDFNQPMISALSRIHKGEDVMLSVGKKDVTLVKEGEKVVERKVPLPAKWIKGLTTVQVFLASSERQFAFNRLQALQLFQSIPSGKPREDYFLVVRGGKAVFSPAKTAQAICVGGVQRLKLVEPLLPLITELRVYAHPQMQSTTWQLYFGNIVFSLSISRDTWRGFSGEGAALEAMIDEVPDEWLDAMDKYSFANQSFNPALLAMEEGIGLQQADNLAARLSAIGLLGFDLNDNGFFYRRLPFKLSRILSLNPRLKDAEKLLAEDKVNIRVQNGNRVEASVQGSGVSHTVIIDAENARCTCTWFSRHQGERGLCKHVLAVKKKVNQL